MSQASANERLKAILKAGKLFEGKYRIMRPLGAGSFAVVVHARHEVMGRDVAMKFLKPKVVESNPEVSERFVKEVQIASRLHHPNVVSIYDFGMTEDGIYYMVQEFVDGVTVDELMPPGRPLPYERVVDMTRQVLSCLEEAHSQGVIHRDLKPSNLMSTTTEDGQEIVKILDFGVAKLLEKSDVAGPTRQSTKFIGTPIYMSPEQILGQEVGPSSDLYSVGLMIYEMVTGQAPIQADQIAEVVQQHLSEKNFDFPMLHLLEPNLQRVILKATARFPEDRFANAAQFQVAVAGVWGDDSEPEDEIADTQIADAGSFHEALGRNKEGKLPSKVRGASALMEEEDEFDIFLGRKYIGPSADELEPDFQPLAPQEQRASQLGLSSADALPLASRAPSSPSSPSARAMPSSRPPEADRARSARQPRPASSAPSSQPTQTSPTTTSALTDVRDLELDMDALRSVRHGRQRSARSDQRSQQVAAKPPREKISEAIFKPTDLLLYGAALVAAYIAFVLLSAVTDLMPVAARVMIGLLPLPVALLWVKFEGRAPNSLAERWLRPAAVRVLILLACVIFLIGLVLSDKAALALHHQGAWFLAGMPKAAPFGWITAATSAMAEAFAVAFGFISGIVPW